MKDKKLKELESKIKLQEEELAILKKKTRKHKWLILSMLFDGGKS